MVNEATFRFEAPTSVPLRTTSIAAVTRTCDGSPRFSFRLLEIGQIPKFPVDTRPIRQYARRMKGFESGKQTAVPIDDRSHCSPEIFKSFAPLVITSTSNFD